jgi:glutamine---fructose-6-phosphate transaminase (isomerizing)
MYRTMRRQPADLRRLLAEGWAPAEQAARLLAPARRVFLTGTGTSYHAALVGEWLLRSVGVDAWAVLSFDLAVYADAHPLHEDDAVIVLSHSGTRTFTNQAMARARDAEATIVSVGGLTAEHPGSQLILRTVEQERSAAFTASHTGAMLVLAQVATGLGDVAAFRSALGELPEHVEAVLGREDEILVVSRLAATRQVYVAGPGPNAATALEAVIKTREAAAAHVDALPLEQFLHGPIATVNPEDLGVLVNVRGAAAAATARTAEIAGILDRIGTAIWLVGQGIPELPNAMVFELPELPEPISPLLAVVPMQIMAYQLAVLNRAHPDRFRTDVPRYARAFKFTL